MVATVIQDDPNNPLTSGLTLIETIVASNQATVDFTGLSSVFTNYFIIGSNIVPVNNDVEFNTQLSVSSTFQTSGYTYGGYSQGGGSTIQSEGSDLANEIGMAIRTIAGDSVNNGTGEAVDFNLYLINPSNASFKTNVFGQCSWQDNDTRAFARNYSGILDSASAVDGIRFLFESGNISSGTFNLYGIK